MFKGEAELRNPETNHNVGHFTETCEDDGTTHARFVLEPPITLSGTETLAIFGGPGPVIEVAAKNGGPTEIREFHGRSGVGCLPEKTEISLVKSPGGDLSTLLIVLGRGTIHREHH
jgi:hypothetical protein